MKPKQIFLTLLLIVIVGGLSALAVHKYENRHQGLSVAQAVAQRDQANAITKQHDSANAQSEAVLSAQNSATQAKLTTACAALKTVKVVSPVCQ